MKKSAHKSMNRSLVVSGKVEWSIKNGGHSGASSTFLSNFPILSSFEKTQFNKADIIRKLMTFSIDKENNVKHCFLGLAPACALPFHQ